MKTIRNILEHTRTTKRTKELIYFDAIKALIPIYGVLLGS